MPLLALIDSLTPRRLRIGWLLAGGMAATQWIATPGPWAGGVDATLFHLPRWLFLAESFRAGSLPLWAPEVGLGRPFFADIENAVLYPGTWLPALLGIGAGLVLWMFLHAVLASVGTGALATRLGAGPLGSLVAAFAWPACGAVGSRIASGQYGYAAVLCWLPLLAVLALEVRDRRDPRSVLALGTGGALALLAGAPPALLVSAPAIAILVALAPPAGATGGEASPPLSAFFRLAMALAFATGITAVQWMPFLELMGQGNRFTGRQDVLTFSLDPAGWASLLLPAPWRDQPSHEFELALGPVLLAAGIVGLARGGLPGRKALVALVAAGILLAAHRVFPVWSWLAGLPGFDSLRVPERFASLAVLGLVLAAGRSFVPEGLPARLRFPLAILAILSLPVHHALNALAWTDRMTDPKPLVIRREAMRALASRDPAEPPPRLLIPATLLPANYHLGTGLASPDFHGSPWLMRPWVALHASLGEIENPWIPTQLPAAYHGKAPFGLPGYAIELGLDPEASGDLVLVPNRSPDPRAWWTPEATRVADFAEAMRRLRSGHSPWFSPIIETGEETTAGSAEPSGRPMRVLWRHFSAGRLVVELPPGRTSAGWLILSEAWFPGWEAIVDGEPAEVLPANGWMRAIRTGPAATMVELRYRPTLLPIGAATSLATLGITGLLVTRRRRTVAVPGR